MSEQSPGHGASEGGSCGTGEGASCCAPGPIAEGPPPGGGDRARYRVRGMDCAEEVAVLKRALAGQVDPEQLGFDLLEGVISVPASVPAGAVIEAVASTGMRAEPQGGATERPPSWWERHGRTALTALSGLALLLGFALHAAGAGLEGATGGGDTPLPAVAAYAVAVLGGLVLVLPKALYALRSLRPDMNLLMTLAVAGAIGLGEWFEAAAVSFLFALSLTLEAWSVGRARRAVRKLLSLAPDQVRVRRGEALLEVSPAAVAVGEVFVVRPGERFGLDGEVLAGESEVNQAPITGESLPVPKAPGDEVFAGTVNGNAALEVRCTKPAGDTTLAHIIQLVADAQQDRADVERWVERFARVYTPAVFAAAAAVAILPPLLGGDAAVWFYRSLVLLVIGCPCALVIATPVAVVAGLASAASRGVLVKGGRFLEIPARLAVVAMDKTGTLTEGQLRVENIAPLEGHSPEELLAAAAAIEAQSTHPIARAITEHAEALGLPIAGAEEVSAVPGKGATGRVAGRDYWLGSHRWLEERGQETEAIHEAITALSGAGRSVVVMGTADHVCGFLTLADTLRPEARASIAALRAAGAGEVVMLTGDNRATAEAIAREVGIDDVRAELLPADKVEAIIALERDSGPTAMIGDGINDAPALARASIGVAMGAMGSDIAVETADVALMSDDLSKLAWLIGHSRRTLGIIRQNTAFALGVKAVFVVLTFGGMASLWGAIAADTGASLLVIFNALRLLRADPQRSGGGDKN